MKDAVVTDNHHLSQMREEILINVTPQETRVAMLENGMLQEVFIEREKNQEITGNIYLGIVVRVLPGMQAAFVDIGLDRTAFLHARDLLDRRDENNQLQQSDPTTSISSAGVSTGSGKKFTQIRSSKNYRRCA